MGALWRLRTVTRMTCADVRCWVHGLASPPWSASPAFTSGSFSSSPVRSGARRSASDAVRLLSGLALLPRLLDRVHFILTVSLFAPVFSVLSVVERTECTSEHQATDKGRDERRAGT